MKKVVMLVFSDELAESTETSGTNETNDLFSFMEDDDTVSDQEASIETNLKPEFSKFIQDKRRTLDSL